MREILFRGKREDGKGWVYGHYHNTTYVGYPNGGDNRVTRHYILPKNAGDAHVIIPETVGQFTGVADTKGKKIFDGDILKVFFCKNGRKNTIFRGKVYFEHGAFNIRYRKHGVALLNGLIQSVRTDDFGVFYEVIGNTHDNPELLED